MVRIGAWKRSGTSERVISWGNLSSGTALQAFMHGNGDWNVSVLRLGHLYENLLGGKSYKENQSQANALRSARQYMREHEYQ